MATGGERCWRPLLLDVLALVTTPAWLAAQEPDPHRVQPERPTVATHAGTVAAGWLEVESGVEFDRAGRGAYTFSWPAVFKVGIGSRAQVSVFATALRPAESSFGSGDDALGVKWRLVDDAPILGDFAVLPSVKFPSGSPRRGTGTGTTDASLLLISSHAFGPVAMDVNVGYTRRGGDGSVTPRDATLWTISLGGPVRGRAGWVAEIYGYPGTSGAAGGAPIVAVLVGPTWLARPWFALDAGMIEPVHGPQPRGVFAGGVYNVGRVW